MGGEIMRTILRALFVCLLGSQVIACASITSGTTQTVSVNTAPTAGAACELANEKGTWQVPKTPGVTTITRAYGDLVVTCSDPLGADGATTVQSGTVGAAFGNIVAGGIIGAAIDMSSGAAYEYPSAITVSMVAKDGSMPTAPGLLPTQPSPAPIVRMSAEEAAGRLTQLRKLKESGDITEAEYQDKRNFIISSL